MLARFGGWCFRNPWLVVGGWFGVIVLVFGSVAAVGGPAFDGTFEIPDSESRDGFDALDEHFDGLGSGQSGSVVFRAESGVDDPAVREAMEAMFAEIALIEGLTIVSPYNGPQGAAQVSTDGLVGYAAITVAIEVDQTAAAVIGQEIAELAPELDGLQVEVGGQILGEFEPPESELIGLAFAVVVLILAFGSVLAMGLPIAVAVSGVGIGMGLVMLISHLTAVPDFATSLGAMIGLGVGIDYALIIVTRYREGLSAGRTPEAAAVAAMDTAGRSVIFAGITVVISLLGMLLMGLAFISGLGISAAATVSVTMLASITLLPALLGFAKERVEVTSWYALVAAGLIAVTLFSVGAGDLLSIPSQVPLVTVLLAVVVFVFGRWIPTIKERVPHRAPKPVRDTVPYKWSRLVQAHPWLWLGAGTLLLVVLAWPVTTLRMGFSDEGNYREETTTRRAYDLLAEGFGPGFNGPFLVTAVVGSPADRAAVEPLLSALASTPGVASVGPPFPNNLANPAESDAYLIQVVPTTAPQDEETSELVQRLREEVVPGAVAGTSLVVSVTGTVAANIDFTEYLTGRLFIFFGAVLTLSFLLLMVVFRSLLVPLKAVVMNVLSIGSAYGIVVAIFQWGWFGELLGIGGAPIEPFIPMMMFAIVFGLSMDYEVFLLSRVKEEYDRTGDARESVADGLASTAHVITAAAAIMVVVFGSFMFEDNRIIKLFGLGLGVAVMLDATIVRMLLVPATMELLGERNWWLPGWLGRVLPVINVEGEAHALEPDEAAGG
ncbi:MAG: MMPL family transporter, partial [Dehalococcoidia bacterium]|nr:MMPL family transporter [Dehalococcoidia bacterium]